MERTEAEEVESVRKAVLLVFLLLVPLLTLNFTSVKAQSEWQIETVGPNYDIFFNTADPAQKKFVSVPQRVQNSTGDWVDYILTEESNYVQVQTGLVAARIFDAGYAEFYSPDMSEVRVYEETWQNQYWSGNKWSVSDTYSPTITVTEASDYGVNVTLNFITDWPNSGEKAFDVKYLFEIGQPLKHEIIFISHNTETYDFRVLQKWAGIIGDRVKTVNGELVISSAIEISGTWFEFCNSAGDMMVFEDQTDATNFVESPIIDTHAQGMKCDFIFSNWTLAQGEILEIDPTTQTYYATAAASGYDQLGPNPFYPPTSESEERNTGYMAGQKFYEDNYYIWAGIVIIDTSPIPDDATISSATFKVTMVTDYSDTDFDVEINPGGSISTSGWSSGQRSVSVSPGSVNKYGNTDFTLVSSRTGTQPTGDEYVVLGGGQLEVTYTVPPTEYYLTVTTAHSTQTGQGWYTLGQTAYAGVASGTVSGGTGKRYVFTHWSGDASGTNYAQSNGISMTSNKQAIANWKTQYYFNVESARGSPTGENWYDSGTTTVKSTVTTPSEGYETTGWTGTGSLSSGGTTGSDDTGTFTITQYSTCTWNWEYTTPTYSDLSMSTTIAGVSCDFNATFNDNLVLETDGQYQFGTNNTETWVWEDAVNFTSTPQTVSVTKTLNSTVGQVVGYCWNFTDNVEVSSTTGIQTITLTDGFSEITANNVITDKPVTLSVTIDDDVEVSHYIWSWNNTGSMVNGTTTAWTSNPVTFDGTWNETAGNTISVLVYANDTSNNWIESTTYNFTLVNYHAYFTYLPASPLRGDSVDITLHVQKAGESFSNYIANITRDGSLWKTNIVPANSTFSDTSLDATTRTYNVSALYDTDLSDFVDYSVAPAAIKWAETGAPSGGAPSATAYAVSIRVVKGTSPVPSVTVTLADTSKITDSQGYAIFSVASGTHTLKVIQDGATVYSSQLQVTEDGVWQVDLNQPDQPPQDITPERGILPEIPSEIAQLGIVVIVAVVLVAFVATQSGKKSTPEREWRSKGKDIKRGKQWKK